MAPVDDVLPVVRENLDAYNSGDRDRFRATLGDDAIWRTPAHEWAGSDDVWRGPDAIADGAWREREAFPDLHGQIINAFTRGFYPWRSGCTGDDLERDPWTGKAAPNMAGMLRLPRARGQDYRRHYLHHFRRHIATPIDDSAQTKSLDVQRGALIVYN